MTRTLGKTRSGSVLTCGLPAGREILEHVVGRETTELSATEQIRSRAGQAGSLRARPTTVREPLA